MAEQYPFEQPTPQDADVVFFSPELLKLADAHRRRQHLEECRQAADNGDCAAAVQMGVNYLAPENCNLNNFVWVFLLILSGVFRLSIKYGLSRFLLSVCCHADKHIISD